jgi:hypothetical protein
LFTNEHNCFDTLAGCPVITRPELPVLDGACLRAERGAWPDDRPNPKKQKEVVSNLCPEKHFLLVSIRKREVYTMRSKVSLYLFCIVLVLMYASAAYAQAPVFDTPVYAQRDGRDVVLEWDAATGANGYNIYRFEDVPIPPPPHVPLATVAGLTYRDVGAVNSPPDKYYYLVAAFNANGETPAPNLAFKLNIVLHWTSGQSNLNFVSLPQLFNPNGRGVQAKSKDLCDAVSPPSRIAQVQMGDYTNCYVKTNPCLDFATFNFALEPGVGYAIVPTQDNVILDIVGSHDPAIQPGGPTSIPLRPWEDCMCSFNTVSVPYNAVADTAEGICSELGLTAPDFVARFVRELDDLYIHTCGSQYHNFSFARGEALTLRTHADHWQPDVYR